MSYADGSGGAFSKPARLRRARSPVRTSPLVSELTLTCEALPFAAALAGLTCRAAPVNSSTFAALTTPEGLRSLRSASSLSFLVTCQRQVIPSHSFAARTRACCAPRIRRRSLTYVPRKWYYGLIYMPCKWLCRPTNALPVLGRTPPEGHWRAHPAAAPCHRQAENR